MHKLASLFFENISSGITRKSLTSCSRWAQSCRIVAKPNPKPWDFIHHPWQREMHDSDAEMNVGQKAAQMGYTEAVLNRTFFMIDIKRVDCLYVLPAKTPDASDFSAARFDPALELSPHLTKMFSDVKNIGHKRAGTTNLYIRGSKSRAGLKSIPVGFIVLDEVEEMDQDNIPLAMERAAGQYEKQVWALSTPRHPDSGINKLFKDTSQDHFFFNCPHCSRLTELIFPECLVITAEDINDSAVKKSHLICKECHHILQHETKSEWLSKGKWIPSYGDRQGRGFYINQLYSSTVTPVDLALSFLRSQRDPTEEQEFYNSKLGLPHIVAGAGINDADIVRSIGGYKKYQHRPGRALITMGVDVGKWLHYEIDQWYIPNEISSNDINVRCQCKVLTHGKILNFEELDDLMRLFGVASCVIDANPERRKAYEFAMRFNGLVKMCFYGQGIQGKQIHVGKESEGEPTITVDRTSWLDLSLGRFKIDPCSISIPLDTSEEYKSHLKSLVRVYEKDKNGNPIGRYVKSNNDDHYAHARNYAELALPFALNLGSSKDITDVY